MCSLTIHRCRLLDVFSMFIVCLHAVVIIFPFVLFLLYFIVSMCVCGRTNYHIGPHRMITPARCAQYCSAPMWFVLYLVIHLRLSRGQAYIHTFTYCPGPKLVSVIDLIVSYRGGGLSVAFYRVSLATTVSLVGGNA